MAVYSAVFFSSLSLSFLNPGVLALAGWEFPTPPESCLGRKKENRKDPPVRDLNSGRCPLAQPTIATLTVREWIAPMCFVDRAFSHSCHARIRCTYRSKSIPLWPGRHTFEAPVGRHPPSLYTQWPSRRFVPRSTHGRMKYARAGCLSGAFHRCGSTNQIPPCVCQ